MARSARRSSQDAKRCVGDATRCEETADPMQPGPVANPLRVADLGDDVREDEAENESTPGRIRTCDLPARSTAGSKDLSHRGTEITEKKDIAHSVFSVPP